MRLVILYFELYPRHTRGDRRLLKFYKLAQDSNLMQNWVDDSKYLRFDTCVHEEPPQPKELEFSTVPRR